jgi:hypothetical protein
MYGNVCISSIQDDTINTMIDWIYCYHNTLDQEVATTKAHSYNNNELIQKQQQQQKVE